MKHSTGSPAIYALHKMSHNMAPTHQRTARKSLATALSKRKLPTPKGVAPLLTFPLGHATFQAELRRFLRQCISKRRDQTIPFHPPSTKVVFRRHPQIQQVLCNWRRTHHRWKPDQPPPCTCQRMRATHYPRLFHGHIAAPLAELLPDQHCLKFSGKSPLFPKVGQLHSQQLRAIQRWHKRNQLPAPPTDDSTLTTFIDHQIQQHLAAARHHINIHIMKQTQHQLPAGIIHCEDHHPNRLLWFCPALYHATITNTFTDASIFTISQAPPLTVHMETQQQLKDMLPNYKKHFGDSRSPALMSFQNARNSSTKDAPSLPLCNPRPRHSGKPFPTCSELCADKLAPTPSETAMPLVSCVSLRRLSSKQQPTTKHTSYIIRTWRASSHP